MTSGAARKWRSIVLLGLPGSGKSTVGRALAELPQFVHFEAGETFRTLPRDSEVGRLVHPILEQGKLVAGDLAVRVWVEAVRSRMDRGEFDPAGQVLLLDGIPRTVEQAELMTGAADVLRMIYLACDDESVLVRRLLTRGAKHGRADDADENRVRRRLELHRREVLPLIHRYADRVDRVDACRGALDVLIDVARIARAALVVPTNVAG